MPMNFATFEQLYLLLPFTSTSNNDHIITLNILAPGRSQPFYLLSSTLQRPVFLLNSHSTPLLATNINITLTFAHVLPKLPCHFAEFLNKTSLTSSYSYTHPPVSVSTTIPYIHTATFLTFLNLIQHFNHSSNTPLGFFLDFVILHIIFHILHWNTWVLNQYSYSKHFHVTHICILTFISTLLQ